MSQPTPPPEPDDENPASMPLDPDDERRAPALPPQADAGATNALSRLLTRSPFTDLHERAGGEHRLRAWVCFCTDYVMRLVIVGLLLFIIAAVVWKTLAPFPDFWQSDTRSDR